MRKARSSFHTYEVSAARREMFRRAIRYGGSWCVFPHPDFPDQFGVSLKDLAPAPAICEHAGAEPGELIRDLYFRVKNGGRSV